VLSYLVFAVDQDSHGVNTGYTLLSTEYTISTNTLSYLFLLDSLYKISKKTTSQL